MRARLAVALVAALSLSGLAGCFSVVPDPSVSARDAEYMALIPQAEIDRAKGLMAQTQTAFGRKVVWCMPAFAGKTMFVRNDKELAAFDLAK